MFELNFYASSGDVTGYGFQPGVACTYLKDGKTGQSRCSSRTGGGGGRDFHQWMDYCSVEIAITVLMMTVLGVMHVLPHQPALRARVVRDEKPNRAHAADDCPGLAPVWW